ncbi:MAG TPA: hypothetical protein EYQ23_05370 [Verrucomicrobiales bacterium]|nr:hypothetical protein [Verrucomicrobiales bacterium]
MRRIWLTWIFTITTLLIGVDVIKAQAPVIESVQLSADRLVDGGHGPNATSTLSAKSKFLAVVLF